jgi:hypothetical protein
MSTSIPLRRITSNNGCSNTLAHPDVAHTVQAADCVAQGCEEKHPCAWVYCTELKLHDYRISTNPEVTIITLRSKKTQNQIVAKHAVPTPVFKTQVRHTPLSNHQTNNKLRPPRARPLTKKPPRERSGFRYVISSTAKRNTLLHSNLANKPASPGRQAYPATS